MTPSLVAPASPPWLDVPDGATAVFGPQLPQAAAYAELLCTTGLEWGLLGPREAPRVWSRHLLNSAALTALVPPGVSVVDLGSGAGLPGLPLALARPDLDVTLVESMSRRTRFLDVAVKTLGLGERVSVVRGRAETVTTRGDVVVSRAVARLGTALTWSLGLTRPAGLVLAMRGGSAQDELEQLRRETPSLAERCRLRTIAGPDGDVRVVEVRA